MSAKTYRERLDANGELARQTAFYSSPLGRYLLAAAGLDEEGQHLVSEYEQITSEPDRIAAALAQIGWIVFEDAPLPDYGAAATLVEQGKADEAEELLVRVWNKKDFMLNRITPRVSSLYWGDEEREALGQERRRLLMEAMTHHRAGHFAGSIAIVLTQIDGIFIDMAGQSARDSFFRPSNPNLVDDESLAGHPLGLKELSRLLSQHVPNTQSTGELLRHGVLHGREVGYDTLRNSTKAWVALFAVATGLKRKADVLGGDAAHAREQRFAGSKQVDEDGKRLDRRGFADAKLLLGDFSGLQLGFHRRNGRYAATRETLDPAATLQGQVMLRVTADGQEYNAWCDTPTGMIFGVAGRGGDFPVWHYQGDEPPDGIGSSSDWRNVATDPALPDW